MAKNTGSKVTLDRDFAFATDGDLNAQIAAFVATHEADAGERLAMDGRRPLGAGKVRVTFRVVEARGGKKKGR